MKTVVNIGLFFFAALTMSGCGSSRAMRQEQTLPAFLIKSNESIAVMPFETESALSNLGAQVSGEVIVNLLHYRPELKIVHAPVVRNYLLNTGGQSDIQKIQSLPAGLQCRYLLTGNLFTNNSNTTYQTDGELLQGLIRALGAEVAKNFYEH